MKMIRMFLITAYALFFSSFIFQDKENRISENFTLVASTPGGKQIKTILGIDLKDSIDFIRWNILLDSSSGKFKIDLQYGISKPNTNGFITTKSKIVEGTFIVSSDVYILESHSLPLYLRFKKINDHLFHILDNDQNLLVGNGGWSYVLNNSNGTHVSELKALDIDYQLFGKKDSLITFR